MDVIDKVKSYIGMDSDGDVRRLLREDHEQILTLVRSLADEDSTPQRRVIFKSLKPLLSAHARAEEQAVYVPLVNVRAKDAKDLGNEGFVEHSLCDILLERLSKTELAGSDAWKAHATVLKELLEHHIEEEENEIFKALGDQFDDARRASMGADFASRRMALLELPSRPRRTG